MLDKSLESTIESIGKRHKTIIPTCLIGTGADFGNLYSYARQICFTLLVKVFYQELYDDLLRSRDDLINSVSKICSSFHIKYTYEECEKIVDSLLWSGSKKYTFAFEEQYFNDKSDKWETYQFQYFEIDRDISELELGVQIYKLSLDSQEIVLKSHEIIEEMDISIQQLVAEMLIKKGNLKSALRMMDALDFRVRKLINNEKAHKEDLIRNPKKAIINNKSIWGKQLYEVKEQFKDELSRYSQMERILNKLDVLDDQRTIFLQLSNRIYKTRSLHDKLAKLVIENIGLELQILNNEFKLMWMSSRSSFRTTVWEDLVLPNGLDDPDDIFMLIELILSPKKPFLLPLEWGLSEQTLINVQDIFDNSSDNSKRHELNPITLDWESITNLWEPIFIELLKSRFVSIEFIQNASETECTKWLQNKEAFDFWLSFCSTEDPLIITTNTINETIDDRITLIRKLIEKNDIFNELFNKQIYTKETPIAELLLKYKLKISKYTLLLKEVN